MESSMSLLNFMWASLRPWVLLKDRSLLLFLFGELHLENAVKEIEKLGFKKELNLKYARKDQLVGRDIYKFQLS